MRATSHVFRWIGRHGPVLLLMVLAAASPAIGASPRPPVRLTQSAALPNSGAGLDFYKIETEAATYYLEKYGAALASMIDREGHDWISFRSQSGSRAAGEFRGFPNAVHGQTPGYFHPRNQNTGEAVTKVERAGPERVTISAVSGGGLWACRYDFLPTHCTFTMTKMPPEQKYWVLYEGTPGGSYDDTDWWMTSAVKQPQAMTVNHEGDIPAPEWIAFGDPKLKRVIFLLHHEDDQHPDRFYQMDRQMTVFGFGRMRGEKHLATVPRQFSIGFLETTAHAEIGRAMEKFGKQAQ
ncbi:MAG: hypothetical protein Q7S40_30160 [Opitutaceae bacterium]|nr:hypothetical protein [Opitutaceae bacterium]